VKAGKKGGLSGAARRAAIARGSATGPSKRRTSTSGRAGSLAAAGKAEAAGRSSAARLHTPASKRTPSLVEAGRLRTQVGLIDEPGWAAGVWSRAGMVCAG
jgi:hypothetical protein